VLPNPVRVSLALQQSRWYGRNKPRIPDGYKIPDSAPPSNRYPFPIKPSQRHTPPEPQPQSRQSPESDISPEQPEFQTDLKSQHNTETRTNPPSTTPASSASESATDSSEVQREVDRKPLPDLTRGIPSTLDAELAEAAAKKHAQTHSLNITEASEEDTYTGGRGGGDGPKSEYISSIDRKRNRVASIMMGVLMSFAVTGIVFMGRNWESDEEERKHPDALSGWGFGLFYNRIKARIADFTDYYNEPAFPKLLPEEDPQYKAPFTLVLSLEDLLVHSEWDREHGWRLAKRPGVDYFLRYLSQYYELVLFTSTPSMLADPVLRKLDPYRIIRWPLFREATRYKNGEYIKV
jgi:mitochondrial import inner membrane translocase subunit TIM50